MKIPTDKTLVSGALIDPIFVLLAEELDYARRNAISISLSTKKHEVPEELLSGLLANYKKPEDLIGENGLLKQLVEKALDAELTEHLGHDRHEAVTNSAGNTRNGKSKKMLKGEFGEFPTTFLATATAALSPS